MNDLSQSKVRIIEVPSAQAGQRIDNFLFRALKGAPKGLIYRILRKGEVRVNRGRIRPDYRLQTGDRIRIPPLRTSEKRGEPIIPRTWLARLEQAILFEDDEILVLDKPSGIAVHAGSGLPFGVIEALRVLRPSAAYLELAHRLDRETSGCLLLAKAPTTLRAIHTALRNGALKKRYLTLVRGYWDQGVREVCAPLRKNVLRSGERVVKVAEEGGKQALTRFRSVSCRQSASLLEAEIATGRTHQIRVHAAHLGHPVAGDQKYGDADFNRMLAGLGLGRLFLHAHSITVPRDGREISVSAPLDDTLRQVLERLEMQQ